MINLNSEQIENKKLIEQMADFFKIDPAWVLAVALTESSLGLNQKSPTGCRGIFQMSKVAMLDLLMEMEDDNDDKIDVACGCAFLFLLLKRWKSIEAATLHFCDPKDRDFYLKRVLEYMKEFKSD